MKQASSAVQAEPSSHADPLPTFEYTHSLRFSLHESSVQSLASSQSTSPVPAQTPPVQVSTAVQNRPSSHEAPSSAGAVAHSSASSSQESTVQPSSSSQSRAVPPQTPSVQTSSTVQKLPSSHFFSLFSK